MATDTRSWSFGDRLVHLKRPEWGVGVVTGVSRITEEGVDAQRLTIRFARAGVKTLSTAVAELGPEDDASATNGAVNGHAGAPAGRDRAAAGDQGMTEDEVREALSRLPDDVDDPFVSVAERFTRTLALYRFNREGGPLLDWAASQSRLADPLAVLSRHDLEQLFDRFARDRDQHLIKLGKELFRKEPGELARVLKGAAPAAMKVLRRADITR